MKGLKKVGQWALVATLFVGLTACGQNDQAEIKVGATVGPHAQVWKRLPKKRRNRA